jgi:7,8-dihydropterin-6-yl-methyl-4-(beta-D-ribofuranosyl)aminobenzene 5'-phosphate synthase
MCDEPGDAGEALAAAPREAPGPAVDPIALQPVDAVEITTLVDNFFDSLLVSGEGVRRPGMGSGGMVEAPEFEGGATFSGLVAEHGFAALVTVRAGGRSTTMLFDTGQSRDAMVRNADRLGINLGELHSVVLSHGHFDHVGGLAGLTGPPTPANSRSS